MNPANKNPRVKNAPGGSMNINIGVKCAPNKLNPNKLPFPSNSLTAPITVRASVNPIPFPRPYTA